jgi:hypothetical protein
MLFCVFWLMSLVFANNYFCGMVKTFFWFPFFCCLKYSDLNVDVLWKFGFKQSFVKTRTRCFYLYGLFELNFYVDGF